MSTMRVWTMCLVVSLAWSLGAMAQEAAPATQTAAFDVQDWLIMVGEPGTRTVNARTLVKSTLPGSIGTRRPAADAAEVDSPQPVGVIRLLGSAAEDDPVDVLLEMKGGTFMAHWPSSPPRVGRLLWTGLAPKTDKPAVTSMNERPWFAALRDTESLWLEGARGSDRFLLYDIEAPYQPAIRITGDGDMYSVVNNTPDVLHDLILLKPADGGWRVGILEQVAAGEAPATQPATEGDEAPVDPEMADEIAIEAMLQEAARVVEPVGSDDVGDEEAEVEVAIADAAPTTAPVATTEPATQPATQPAGVEVRLAAPEPLDQAMQRIADVLRREGIVSGDIAAMRSIIEAQLDPRHLTVLYRMDPARYDALLPLEVLPTPRRTVRVGLVIVRNVDPAAGQEIETLIAQLGDDDWSTREAAETALADYGPVATEALKAATKNQDMEIVFRAERLLRRLEVVPSPAE